MERYSIKLTSEKGIYTRNDNYFIELTIKDILTSSVSDPSTVSISIKDPCGITIVNNDAMISTATGIYVYDYAISSSATYGVYEVIIETSSYNMIDTHNFVIMPWNCLSQVRRISGISQQNDISDEKLSLIIWDTYIETLEQIYEKHKDEKLLCNPDNGTWFDGTNTKFQLRYGKIADINGDGQVTGYGELNCGYDVSVRWIDSTGDSQIGKVTVDNLDNRIVLITQLSGVAIPNTNEGVFVTYWIESDYYNERLMRKAVSYLAAHELILAFQSLYEATLADLPSNEKKLSIDMYRLQKKYDDIIEEIGHEMIGGGK